MLNDASINYIVCWCQNDNNIDSCSGNNTMITDDAVFVVKNAQLFSQKVIPQYFDCTLSSFKRQLNYYGFVRVSVVVVDEEVNVNVNLSSSSKGNLATMKKKKSRAMRYRHERNKFQKGRMDLLHDIQRSTCNDPKIQIDYLREKVGSLEDENLILKQEVSNLKADMAIFRRFMEGEENRRANMDVVVPSDVHVSRTKSKLDHLSSISLSRTASIEIGDHDWESVKDMLMISHVPLIKKANSTIMSDDQRYTIDPGIINYDEPVKI